MFAIILIIAALFLVGYAAVANAKMDTVKDHWNSSIYTDRKKYNDEWFDPRLSWSNKIASNFTKLMMLANQYLPDWAVYVLEHKNKPFDPFTDFWHWEKCKMIWSLCASAALTLVAGILIGKSVWGLVVAFMVMYYIGAGTVWIQVFNLYYDRILLQKPFKKRWLWLKASV